MICWRVQISFSVSAALSCPAKHPSARYLSHQYTPQHRHAVLAASYNQHSLQAAGVDESCVSSVIVQWACQAFFKLVWHPEVGKSGSWKAVRQSLSSVRCTAVFTTPRTLLANTLLPSPSRTQTHIKTYAHCMLACMHAHTHAHMHARTHRHTHDLSLCCSKTENYINQTKYQLSNQLPIFLSLVYMAMLTGKARSL